MGKLTLREVKRFAQGHMTSKCRKSGTQVSQHLVLVTFSLWLHGGTVLHLCEINLWLAVRIWREQHLWLEWVEISAASNTYWFPLLCCHGKTQLSITHPEESSTISVLFEVSEGFASERKKRSVWVWKRRWESAQESCSWEGFPRWQLSTNMLSSPISFFIVICCDN